jgi:hypothetical protein
VNLWSLIISHGHTDFGAYTQKNKYSINKTETKFLGHEHFFNAILILEQFYKAKKKKEFLKQFFPISV